jgi:hypothetical protein
MLSSRSFPVGVSVCVLFVHLLWHIHSIIETVKDGTVLKAHANR